MRWPGSVAKLLSMHLSPSKVTFRPERPGGAPFLPAGVTVALLIGGCAWLLGQHRTAHGIWAAALLVVGVPLTRSVAKRIRRGQPGADVIALLAIAGALALGEYLAGAVIALMLSGGDYLDARAFGRARRELGALVERAPTIAHREGADGMLADVAAGLVTPGDVILVKHGEVIPVDAVVLDRAATLDESALTGESLPSTHALGSEVRSGASISGDAVRLRAVRPASASTYAEIVRLVESAEADRAPTMRLADRAAAIFLPVTLTAAGAGWLITGGPRAALAVLVVATPCPLILATPVAFVSGIASAARRGIIVKGGGVLERLGQVSVVALDKTGTLTEGHAELVRGDDETLRLAASADALSTHPLAAALVEAAHRRQLALETAHGFREQYGDGVEAMVAGRRVLVGRSAFVGQEPFERAPGEVDVHVSIDGEPAGVLTLADRVRPSAIETVASLRSLGTRVLMLSGDDQAVADRVAAAVGLERVEAEATPQGKADVIAALHRSGDVVAMVGDGVNDAPALALADVGIALAARGATISSATADVVITVDDIARVAEAIAGGKRTLRIARQGIALGMGLSVVLMVVAAAGELPPLWGAVAQEVIDVAAILNALRALRGTPGGPSVRSSRNPAPRMPRRHASPVRRGALRH
jgi:heavy metal translocating P-type ATPase